LIVTVTVELPEQTIRDLANMAEQKKITRTEALIQAIETSRRLLELAPSGAMVEPIDGWHIFGSKV
jgi:hypothetical protein